jgi:hypothetical protein
VETLRITKADLNERNEYTRSRDLEFEGHIEVEASLGRVVVLGLIRAGGRLGIEAGSGIKAGWGIEAGWGIKAGWGIEAGLGIEAGWGIEAGFSIQCKLSISVKLRIFAGLCMWCLPRPEEQVIECAELASGTVAFGTLKLIEAPKKGGK